MDLIDKRDEVLRTFLEYGISECKENDLTKADLAECAEAIVKKLIIPDVTVPKSTVVEITDIKTTLNWLLKNGDFKDTETSYNLTMNSINILEKQLTLTDISQQREDLITTLICTIDDLLPEDHWVRLCNSYKKLRD